jgi:hypothetical protein
MPQEVCSLWYWIVSASYGALGGVIALIMPAVTLWGAFYAGLSLPAIIGMAAKHRVGQGKWKHLADEQDLMPKERPLPGEIEAARAGANPIETRLAKAVEAFRDHADALF